MSTVWLPSGEREVSLDSTEYQPRYIMLEGVSGSGKSALLHPVSELSKRLDVVVMRGSPSCWVYGKMYNRPSVDYETLNESLQSSADVHVVWLMVRPEEAYRRKILKGDDHLIEDVDEAHYWYRYYFTYVTKLRQVHWVDTSDRSEEEVVEEIGRKIYGRRGDAGD